MKHQRKITLNKITAILFIAIMALFTSSIAFAQNTSATANTIMVSGTASIKAPIIAIDIHISIDTLEDSPQKAQTRNNQKVEALVKALNDLGIKNEYIETDNVRLYPRYEYNYDAEKPEDRKKLMGYQINNPMTIRIQDQSIYGDIIFALTTKEVDNINSIEYIMSTDDSYYNKALALAFENAKKKAEALASASHTSIDEAKIIITESNTQVSPYLAPRTVILRESRESNTSIPKEKNIEATVYVTFFLLKK